MKTSMKTRLGAEVRDGGLWRGVQEKKQNSKPEVPEKNDLKKKSSLTGNLTRKLARRQKPEGAKKERAEGGGRENATGFRTKKKSSRKKNKVC